MILSPLIDKTLFRNSLINTSCTAFEQPSSIVKRSLSQSQEEPSFFKLFNDTSAVFFFQAQARLRKPSLPISSFCQRLLPSLLFTILASVAIACMVCTRQPKCAVALHSLPADENILHMYCQEHVPYEADR